MDVFDTGIEDDMGVELLLFVGIKEGMQVKVAVEAVEAVTTLGFLSLT